MKKVYKFKVLKDYPPYLSVGDILEGYYTSFVGYPIVQVGNMGIPRHQVEELEFLREEEYPKPNQPMKTKKFDFVDTGRRTHDILCGDKSDRRHPENELKDGETCPICGRGLPVVTIVEVSSETNEALQRTPTIRKEESL